MSISDMSEILSPVQALNFLFRKYSECKSAGRTRIRIEKGTARMTWRYEITLAEGVGEFGACVDSKGAIKQ